MLNWTRPLVHAEMIAFSVLTLLAVGVWIRSRYLAWQKRKRTTHELSDAMIAQIEREGRLTWEPDEPLDMRRIRAEEERFWSTAAWDEPEST